MIVHGSINYTPSGRKRKIVRSKIKKYEFKELTKTISTPDRQYYPSRDCGGHQGARKEFPKANGVTVSIPYNKGAYQVVPKSEIKYIGK